MRLWHQHLIEQLPTPQLNGQHRECCALRGNGWGKKHRTVNYVFLHNPAKLVAYHLLIIKEKSHRANCPKTVFLSISIDFSTPPKDYGLTVSPLIYLPFFCLRRHENSQPLVMLTIFNRISLLPFRSFTVWTSLPGTQARPLKLL